MGYRNNDGSIFCTGFNNSPSLGGLIKSITNGDSWTLENALLSSSLNFVYSIEKDCYGNLFAIGDDKIYKSTDNGLSWIFTNSVPGLGASYLRLPLMEIFTFLLITLAYIIVLTKEQIGVWFQTCQ